MNHELIFHNLRQWRNEKAFSEGKQPFMIFNNAALKATAESCPSNLQELTTIKGWGPAKIKKYGHEILNLLESLQQKNNSNNPEQPPEKLYIPEEYQDNHILSVAECITAINKHLNEMVMLQVQGEINDISKRNRYAFFNLKDKSGEYTLPCFIGWQNFDRYEHVLEEGSEILISASPSIYKTGRFSMDIKRIEPIGEGALKKAFEALKKKLEQQGYFNESRKQQLPINPSYIGLVTSHHGAAIKDFKQNLKNYGFRIRFEHVYVEGESAVSSITAALQNLNIKYPDLDLIVLIRGGGGLENLKAFNAQEIADAIVSSKIPIISGIGHEKDISIADLCADAYFSTPTATAHFLSQCKEKLVQNYTQRTIELLASGQEFMQHFNHNIELQTHHLIQNYTRILSEQKNKLKLFFTQLAYIVGQLIYGLRNKRYALLGCLNIYEKALHKNLHNVQLAEELLTQLNPQKLLEKGYSIVYNKQGKVIKSIKNINKGDTITIQLHDGKINSKVIKN